jgi:hypothetical protein
MCGAKERAASAVSFPGHVNQLLFDLIAVKKLMSLAVNDQKQPTCMHYDDLVGKVHIPSHRIGDVATVRLEGPGNCWLTVRWSYSRAAALAEVREQQGLRALAARGTASADFSPTEFAQQQGVKVVQLPKDIPEGSNIDRVCKVLQGHLVLDDIHVSKSNQSRTTLRFQQAFTLPDEAIAIAGLCLVVKADFEYLRVGKTFAREDGNARFGISIPSWGNLQPFLPMTFGEALDRSIEMSLALGNRDHTAPRQIVDLVTNSVVLHIKPDVLWAQVSLPEVRRAAVAQSYKQPYQPTMELVDCVSVGEYSRTGSRIVPCFAPGPRGVRFLPYGRQYWFQIFRHAVARNLDVKATLGGVPVFPECKAQRHLDTVFISDWAEAEPTVGGVKHPKSPTTLEIVITDSERGESKTVKYSFVSWRRYVKALSDWRDPLIERFKQQQLARLPAIMDGCLDRQRAAEAARKGEVYSSVVERGYHCRPGVAVAINVDGKWLEGSYDYQVGDNHAVVVHTARGPERYQVSSVTWLPDALSVALDVQPPFDKSLEPSNEYAHFLGRVE